MLLTASCSHQPSHPPLPILFGGREFVAYTNHKPLTFAFGKVLDHWSPQQQRHLACISEFTTNVRHVAGKENHMADALSRCLVNSIHMQIGVDYAAMATAQRTGDEMAAYRASDTGLILQDVPLALLATLSSATCPPVNRVQLSPQPADIKFSMRYIIYRTQQFGQRVPSSLTSLYGKASASRSAIGPRIASRVRLPKSSATSRYHSRHLPSWTAILTTCTLIWLDRFRHRKVSLICLQ